MFTEKKSILERKRSLYLLPLCASTNFSFISYANAHCANMSQHEQKHKQQKVLKVSSWNGNNLMNEKSTQRVFCFIYSRWTRLHKEKFIFGSFIFHIFISRENFHCRFQFNERCQGFIMWSLFVFRLRLPHALFIVLMIFISFHCPHSRCSVSLCSGGMTFMLVQRRDNQISDGDPQRGTQKKVKSQIWPSRNASTSVESTFGKKINLQLNAKQIDLRLIHSSVRYNCVVLVINYLVNLGPLWNGDGKRLKRKIH